MDWKDSACCGACARAKTAAPILLAALISLEAAGNVLRADQVTDAYGSNTPVNSWAYFKLVNAGHPGDINYVPRQEDYRNALFEGFVVTPATGAWGGPNFFGDDTIFIFQTYVYSPVDQTIPLVTGGDDGTSVYINGVFEGGGPFNTATYFNLDLKAGVWTQLEVADHNAFGPWIDNVFRQGDRARLVDIPNVTIQATPEPASIFLVAVGLAGLKAGAYRKRRLAVSKGSWTARRC